MGKVSVVVVTYNNVNMLSSLLQGLSLQSLAPNQVIVVDNAQSQDTQHLLGSKFPAFRYFRLDENLGSAGGFHEGIKLAAPEADFIWTLDDDVRIEKDSLEMLVRGFEELSRTVKVGAVRSVGVNHRPDFPTEIKLAPWRGTLFSAQALKSIGLPLKELFIYGEDLEYSLRLREKGYFCFWVPKSKCVEKRMGYTQESLFGREVRIYTRAFQLYYAFRNGIYVYALHRKPWEVAKIFFYAIKVILYILITQRTQGFKNMKAVADGLRDGFLRRLGKNMDYLP